MLMPDGAVILQLSAVVPLLRSVSVRFAPLPEQASARCAGVAMRCEGGAWVVVAPPLMAIESSSVPVSSVTIASATITHLPTANWRVCTLDHAASCAPISASRSAEAGACAGVLSGASLSGTVSCCGMKSRSRVNDCDMDDAGDAGNGGDAGAGGPTGGSEPAFLIEGAGGDRADSIVQASTAQCREPAIPGLVAPPPPDRAACPRAHHPARAPAATRSVRAAATSAAVAPPSAAGAPRHRESPPPH